MAAYSSTRRLPPPRRPPPALPTAPPELLDSAAGLGMAKSRRTIRAQAYVPAAPAAEQDTVKESAAGMEARADQTPTGTPTVTANAARLAKVLQTRAQRAKRGETGLTQGANPACSGGKHSSYMCGEIRAPASPVLSPTYTAKQSLTYVHVFSRTQYKKKHSLGRRSKPRERQHSGPGDDDAAKLLEVFSFSPRGLPAVAATAATETDLGHRRWLQRKQRHRRHEQRSP